MITIPIHVEFNVTENGTRIDRGQIDFSLTPHGQVFDVVLSGVHVKRMMTPEEFIEHIFSQGYLLAKATAVSRDREIDACTAHKKLVELRMERKA